MYTSRRGVTIIDTLVGVALMALTFMGISAVFQLSVDVVTNNKARTTAIALANQRLEYAHSIAYASLGMQNGIPAGIIPETETTTFNGVNFTRRTFIAFKDDPADGVGASDTNNIQEDYKMVKVDVSWNIHGNTKHVSIATRISPPGLETNLGGGMLAIAAVNATGVAVPGATVRIVNNSLAPTVDETLLADASGTAYVLGAPTSTAYQIIVTTPGYSTAQTYPVSAQNTSPTPLNLTVTDNVTTAGTFAIDLLGRKIINTWTQIFSAAWSDTFPDASKLAATASTTVSGGSLTLLGSAATGTALSVSFGTSTIASWGTVTITHTIPSGTAILYRVYDSTGTTLVPDGQVPGNSAGLATTIINLSGVSTSTYKLLTLGATLSTTNASKPSVDSWAVGYTYGPLTLGNIGINIQGTKSIGSGPGGMVYKYTTNTTTSSLGTITLNGLEWDSHTISVLSSSGYDAASVCNPQPEALAPGATLSTDVYLAPHTTNSLLVDVRLQSNGSLLSNAAVNINRSGTNLWALTDRCGQAFFSGLTSAANYTVTSGITGHATTTMTNVNISGQTRSSVVVN